MGRWASVHRIPAPEAAARAALDMAEAAGVRMETGAPGTLRATPAGALPPAARAALARPDVKQNALALLASGPRLADSIPPEALGVPYWQWHRAHLLDRELTPVQAASKPAPAPPAPAVVQTGLFTAEAPR